MRVRKLGGGWMDEKDKLSGIEKYLKELFPGFVIENLWDSKSHRHLFRVDAPTGETPVNSSAITERKISSFVLNYIILRDISKCSETKRFW